MKLTVENASFAYPHGKPLFENLSFELQTPGVLGVLGANGAGKTTLLKCVLGFEKWTAGREYLAGRDVAHVSGQDFWRHIAYGPRGD